MGANVGSAISESVALILFTMLIFDIKIDLKKAILILIGAGLVVLGFAAIDIFTGSESHLSLFINQY
ncbi:putative membrane protein [[Clostridium] sordellii ATCC 9714]|nr:putative membrane protein [[Clostridium] sordellii ATCC 9714] [Paeniclostridium sordellii ATCC 9714]